MAEPGGLVTPMQERAALARIANKFPDQRFTYGAKDLNEFIAACEAAAFDRGVKQVNHALKLIERAEQRERCASIAWEYGREETDPLYKDFACEVADEIADRIRNASLAPGERPEQQQTPRSTPKHTRR